MKHLKLFLLFVIIGVLSPSCTKSANDVKEEKEVKTADSLISTDQEKMDSAEAYWKKKMDESKSEE